MGAREDWGKGLWADGPYPFPQAPIPNPLRRKLSGRRGLSHHFHDMEEQQKRKLERILRDLKKLSVELEEILSDDLIITSQWKSQGKGANENMEKLYKEIAALDRDSAIYRLKELKHKELGELFLLAGGSSAEKKRPKEWLAERIVWRLFDYKHGLETIRGLGEK